MTNERGVTIADLIAELCIARHTLVPTTQHDDGVQMDVPHADDWVDLSGCPSSPTGLRLGPKDGPITFRQPVPAATTGCPESKARHEWKRSGHESTATAG